MSSINSQQLRIKWTKDRKTNECIHKWKHTVLEKIQGIISDTVFNKALCTPAANCWLFFNQYLYFKSWSINKLSEPQDTAAIVSYVRRAPWKVKRNFPKYISLNSGVTLWLGCWKTVNLKCQHIAETQQHLTNSATFDMHAFFPGQPSQVHTALRRVVIMVYKKNGIIVGFFCILSSLLK
jgi:hypothetical protein